ncbi:MAG: 30S ribosomal protein S20 [Solirubrobacteraceae bacterium]
MLRCEAVQVHANFLAQHEASGTRAQAALSADAVKHKALRMNTDKSDASAKLSNVVAMIDKLAKKNVIHDNKASNLKSKLTKHVNKL